ncbi:hypothetical protein [Streptomyces sp. NPDC001292]
MTLLREGLSGPLSENRQGEDEPVLTDGLTEARTSRLLVIARGHYQPAV